MRFYALPITTRIVLTLAVLSPWPAAAWVVTHRQQAGPPAGVPGLLMMIGFAGFIVSLGLAIADPGLRGRRGRWIAGFVFASAFAAPLYLLIWQWMRQYTKPPRSTRR